MGGLWVAELLLTFLEVEMGICVCDSLLEQRGKYSFAGMEAAGVLAVGLLYTNKLFGGLPSNMAWLVLVLVFALAAKACYRERWLVIWAVFSLFYAGMLVRDFIVLIVGSLAAQNERLGAVFLNDPSWRLGAFFGALRLVECGLLWQCWKWRDVAASWIRQKRWLYGSLGLAVFCFIIQIQDISVNFDFLRVYPGEILFVAGIAAVGLFRPHLKKIREEKQRLEREQEIQRLVNEKLREENQENRRRLHDEKNYLQMLEGLIRDDRLTEAKACLQKLLKQKEGGKPVTRTGDEILDLFLNGKVVQAEERGVMIRIDSALFSCPIDSLDLCSIFGNLLDNAIEACEGLTEEKRVVSIKLRTQGNTLYGEVRNFFTVAPRKENGIWLSAKRGFREGGEGVGIVRRLAEKYQGELSLAQTEEEFCAGFMLVMEKPG